MIDFDRLYREQPDFFGPEASPLLVRFGSQVPSEGAVLDLGAGQGRNCLTMARRGCRVTGLDTSRVAIETVADRAAAEDLSLELWHGDFMDFEPAEPFDAVLCFGLLQLLPKSRAASLVFRMREWTRPGGIVFLTAWHVDDPDYAEVASSWERLGLHSFRSPEDEVRTFLARGQVLDLFRGWQVIHHWEGLGPEHRHAGGPAHRHGAVELVAARE